MKRSAEAAPAGALERLQLRGAGGALAPFHLAIPVADIAEARAFYGEVLGCPEGRSAPRWVDWDFGGHQLVTHQVDGYNAATALNAVDGDAVPVPHFGIAMAAEDFHRFAARCREGGVDFVIEPRLRFEGQPGEQWTMFFRDPFGNCLEFKAMAHPENLFVKYNAADDAATLAAGEAKVAQKQASG